MHSLPWGLGSKLILRLKTLTGLDFNNLNFHIRELRRFLQIVKLVKNGGISFFGKSYPPADILCVSAEPT